jgi:hypothetical protein
MEGNCIEIICKVRGVAYERADVGKRNDIHGDFCLLLRPEAAFHT